MLELNMNNLKTLSLLASVVSVLLLPSLNFGQSNDKGSISKTEMEDQKFSVADGKFHFVAPGSWKKVKPKFQFYHAEFSIPKVEGDPNDGRITFSQVGGSIDANLDRWVGQFKDLKNDDADSVKKVAKEFADTPVQIIHIKGTFMEGAGGPFGKKTEREDYVLMGAALETGSGSNVYIKAYGPSKTMEKNHEHLKNLLEKMTVTD